MSAQVNNNSFSNIGRMFARRNVPEIYGSAKATGALEADAASEQVDKVSLSPYAPRPLPARLLEEAMDTARIMEEGKRLPSERLEKLREDRVFAAMSALAAIGDEGGESTLPRAWPAGLPAPTADEMDAARRRLAQRLDKAELADNPAAVQDGRIDLLRRIGRRDFAGSQALAATDKASA